jgi:tRNA pseudouridine38-40 synthase
MLNLSSSLSDLPESLPAGWRRLRLTLEWDGTGFNGWQVQSQGERTIQGVLEAALQPLGEAGRPMAAGRTDTGVHALEMPVHVDVGFQLSTISILRALNSRLPEDVRVLHCEEVGSDFHARFSCRWRSYSYRIFNSPIPSALERHRALWVPQRLEVAPMRNAAQHLVGLFDFAAFATKEERQTVREVYACDVRAIPTRHRREELRYIEVNITGESFLRHMVRGIVGTLLEVGIGKTESAEVLRVLESRDRAQAGPNVSPHGLYFAKGGYEPFQS